MNSENSKASEPLVLILKLTDKLDLKRGEKSIALSNLSIHYTWENIKSSYDNNNIKISAPTLMTNLNYHTEHILYQTFKIILGTS